MVAPIPSAVEKDAGSSGSTSVCCAFYVSRRGVVTFFGDTRWAALVGLIALPQSSERLGRIECQQLDRCYGLAICTRILVQFVADYAIPGV